MTEIIHNPWVGNKYKYGIDGNKIAIVGYSHWKGNEDPEVDNVDATIKDMEIISNGGRSNIQFFFKIRRYFNHQSSDFWNSVLFFNFIPNYIGAAEDRHAQGTAAQIDSGKQRFYDILHEHLPHKIFVFSRKAWDDMPPTLENSAGKTGDLILAGQPSFKREHYFVNGQFVQAFALRHTQGALDAVMYPVVSAAMALSPNCPTQLQKLVPQ